MSNLNNERVLLSRYYNILEENQIAGYLQCKHTAVSFKNSDSTEKLWQKHDKSCQEIKINENIPRQSLLDLKNELASRIFKQCCFCERKCRVDRGKKSGFCGVRKSRVASEFLHYGEENMLIPSYTIFFSGCTFNCVFCQNWDISQQICGIDIKPAKLADLISKRETQGARNVNWVGGDPTPNLLYIFETLKQCNSNIPQIWNSNMYCSNETMKLLKGVVDLYLTDFKYGNNKCAKNLSKADNYVEIIQRNHKTAHGNGDIIIRHLIMPNHIECCSKPVIRWIADNLPNAMLNIMAQYRPEYHANEYADISRPINIDELKTIKEYEKQLNIQEI